jgi:regulator of RNase E activity RraA
VNVAGVHISAGDLVAFDDDGVVCIPAASADVVIERAQRILQRELERDRDLEASLER